jgi:hypothetical protein
MCTVFLCADRDPSSKESYETSDKTISTVNSELKEAIERSF